MIYLITMSNSNFKYVRKVSFNGDNGLSVVTRYNYLLYGPVPTGIESYLNKTYGVYDIFTLENINKKPFKKKASAKLFAQLIYQEFGGWDFLPRHPENNRIKLTSGQIQALRLLENLVHEI